MWHCKCKCGNECNVRGDSLRSGHTQSCGCIQSKGEVKIGQLLRQVGIEYEKEKRFSTDIEINSFRFDFYIPKQNYLIEFDGIQHFKSIGGWNTPENLLEVQKHDKIKNEYCIKNNIPLIRIPYWHLNNLCIDDLLPELSKFLIKGE